jgi:hypothetical protein
LTWDSERKGKTNKTTKKKKKNKKNKEVETEEGQKKKEYANRKGPVTRIGLLTHWLWKRAGGGANRTRNRNKGIKVTKRTYHSSTGAQVEGGEGVEGEGREEEKRR